MSCSAALCNRSPFHESAKPPPAPHHTILLSHDTTEHTGALQPRLETCLRDQLEPAVEKYGFSWRLVTKKSDVGSEELSCDLAIVLVTHAYLNSPAKMEELHTLLDRWDNAVFVPGVPDDSTTTTSGTARSTASVGGSISGTASSTGSAAGQTGSDPAGSGAMASTCGLVAAFMDVPFGYLKEAAFSGWESWCHTHKVDQWRKDLRRLTKCTHLRMDKWGGVNLDYLAKLIAEGAARLLEKRHQPEWSMGVISNILEPRPSQQELFLEKQLEAMALLLTMRFVEVCGQADASRTALVQNLVEQMRQEWKSAPTWEAANKKAYALRVDLTGLSDEDTFRDELNKRIIEELQTVGVILKSGDKWQGVMYWAQSVQRPAPLLFVFENAQDSFSLDEFQEVLDDLSRPEHIYLIVTSSKRVQQPVHVKNNCCLIRMDSMDRCAISDPAAA